MLILTRRPEESIIIGDTIVVKVVRIQGNQVQIGISAPAELPVHRQEVYELASRVNRGAAGGKAAVTRLPHLQALAAATVPDGPAALPAPPARTGDGMPVPPQP